jgi:flagellin-like protein
MIGSTMNFQRVQKKNRKAISPVLATVILIAITLIAAIAIAGFVFGLFGTFTATARVQASVTTCVITGGHEVCTIVLTNSGNANTAATTSCSLTYGGATHTGTFSNTNSIVSGTPITGTCTDTGAGAAAGSQVTGAVILNNGGNALFSATAS